MKGHFWSIITTVLLLFSADIASAEDWRIFGTYGTVQVTPKGGVPVTIKKEKSLMMKVQDGSTVTVIGKGKIVIVSLKSRKAFEIGDDTTAVVDPDAIRSLNGSVRPRSGFEPPSWKDSKMGGVVMRGAGNRSCLKAVSPVNTNILDLTPELVWENHCIGLDKVRLTIISDERVVHSAESVSGLSYRVPANLLKEGSRYLWMIDGGATFDMTSGIFMLASGKEREEVLQRIQEAKLADTAEDRIAYIFFLTDRGYSEMARKEVARLRSDFPESPGLTELF